jgi:Reverse transcriptase (RNA-dependent DNA polymerase)
VLEVIERWRKAGILDGTEMVSPDKGSPQGAVRSPRVANGYVHEVLDTWCETVGKAHGRGQVVLYRYADDVLIGCEWESDARRIREVLPKRCAKYGRVLPTSPRESRCSFAYSHPYEKHPMTWRQSCRSRPLYTRNTNWTS